MTLEEKIKQAYLEERQAYEKYNELKAKKDKLDEQLKDIQRQMDSCIPQRIITRPAIQVVYDYLEQLDKEYEDEQH